MRESVRIAVFRVPAVSVPLENVGRKIKRIKLIFSSTMFAVALSFSALLSLAVPPQAEGQTLDENILYNFNGGDGVSPVAGLIMDASGNLYGTTYLGGANNNGTVFKLVNSSGTYSEKVLYSFPNTSGYGPAAGLIMDASGNLYGTTQGSGTNGPGTTFELVNNSGTYSEKTLYEFTVSSGDGWDILAGLIMDASGNLYGTAWYGGTANDGTVFELVNSSRMTPEQWIRSADGTYSEKVLHSFTGTPGDGANSYAGLIMDASGNLYGTTSYGGDANDGTVFELLNSSGAYSEKVLYSFTGTNGDGATPVAGLIMDASGNLYGTTESGGDENNYGTVFELVNSSGTYSEQVLYTFTGIDGDGAVPHAGLIMDESSNLYGTTTVGGANGDGTVFELVNSSGIYSEQVLHSFPSTSGDGEGPYAGLIMDESGNLYGTTSGGGANGDGTVFMLVPKLVRKIASILLTAGPNPAVYGSTVMLNAAITASGPAPTGTVTFLNYGAMLGMVPLRDGVAEFPVSTLPVGTNKLTARYSGDQNYPAATSSAVIEIVKTLQTNSFPPLTDKE